MNNINDYSKIISEANGSGGNCDGAASVGKYEMLSCWSKCR